MTLLVFTRNDSAWLYFLVTGLSTLHPVATAHAEKERPPFSSWFWLRSSQRALEPWVFFRAVPRKAFSLFRDGEGRRKPTLPADLASRSQGLQVLGGTVHVTRGTTGVDFHHGKSGPSFFLGGAKSSDQISQVACSKNENSEPSFFVGPRVEGSSCSLVALAGLHLL